MNNPYDLDAIDLTEAGRKRLEGFKGAVSFRMALNGATRDHEGRYNGGAQVADQILWVSIGEHGPIPLYPGETVRSLDGEAIDILWAAAPGVVALVLRADPERFEADFRKRAL